MGGKNDEHFDRENEDQNTWCISSKEWLETFNQETKLLESDIVIHFSQVWRKAEDKEFSINGIQ